MSNHNENWQLKMAPFTNCTLFPPFVPADELSRCFNNMATKLQSFTDVGLKYFLSTHEIFALPFLMTENDEKLGFHYPASIETSKNIIN